MHHRRVAPSRLWLALPLWIGLALNAHAIVVPARAYERHSFTEPSAHAAVQASGELSGGRTGASGWVEYQVRTEATGWYRLSTRGDSPAGVEFAIDADEEGNAPTERYFYQRDQHGGSLAPVGNVWLTEGMHRIRLTRYFWTGFPRISAIELRRSSPDLAAAVQIYFRSEARVFRSGECPTLVAHGGGPVSGALQIVHTSLDGVHIGTHAVTFDRTPAPVDHAVSLDCTRPGFHRLTWQFNGLDPPPDAQPSLTFQVIDTSAEPSRSSAAPSPPLLSIDCSARTPDYVSGTTRVRPGADTMYRESGDSGWIPFQRSEVARRADHAPPSWFAYALPDIPTQQRLRIEVDYPNDRPSTFAVAWRDAAPLNYVPAIAVETGREHRLSATHQTLAFHVWAHSPRSRLVLLPAHDGDRAACSAIRIFADNRYSTMRDVAPAQARRFLNWYEEGENFVSLYGQPTDDAQGFDTAVERWFLQADDTGVNTLMPTVSVYNFGMYPSRFNRSFSEPQRDRLRVLMLHAERFGLQVIPELHPRGDDLDYASDGRAAIGRLAISKDGRDSASNAGEKIARPPYFNALESRNQEWYVGMIRELTIRYRDSQAFQGVSLRYMTWANPALNNLVSLDWGYDDATLARYRRDTGSRLPALDSRDSGRFARRHDWLLAHEKAAWIAWRCAQLTQLFVRLRDALREARPDLTLYLHVFGPSVADAATFQTALEEAGLDLKALAAIDGIVILNSSFSYGRLEQDGVFFNADRDPLLNASAMGATASGRNRPWMLPTSRYLESIGELIATPHELGLTGARPAWMSAASNPAGAGVLERFAVLLAQTDALALGDGGNNLTLGSPQVAQFAREFRKLPPVPFDQVPGASDPVTVRSFAAPSRFIFYAVNREDYPIDLRVALSNGQVRELTLQAYGLKVIEEDRDVRIAGVVTLAPQPEHDRIARRIAWVQALVAGKGGTPLPSADATLLTRALNTAQRALYAGHLWEARTALETSAVLRMFRGSGCFPPDLREQFPVESRCRSN